ncbi:glycosyltransferase [Ornithinimicrobium cryptoxanthini]|uniref:Glycosyltransferase family 2 protein n=1 Tax=Ornithinimicrobium cryptoxanthini TaxID=2934161 RepID=A0ABY4YJT9_9MICO|nr:glycosyltransferase family A protein [Ornithinimicrobium cryptoxanthini]USQ76593.1 glycosyltransferase family 2 protein [Ornithinimicrobium cryptoxanthini]
MPQRVAVIIPAHNAASTLPQQLEALATQVGAPPFDVVVVDNRSTDDTAQVARALGATVVSAPSRPGVHHARNEGVRATDHELILHCDADDLVNESWVADIVRSLDQHDVIGGAISFERVNDPTVAAVLTSPTAEGPPVCMGRTYALGGNMGYRRSVWLKVGGFDESFESGHEEVDFCWRARAAGASVGFAPTAVVFYRQRADLRTLTRQRFYFGRSFAQLYSKHQAEDIPRVSAKMEARKIAMHLLNARKLVSRSDLRRPWLMHSAWVAGRLAGNVKFRVRAPG